MIFTRQQRAQGRRWLENWRHAGRLLESERRARLAALTDDTAWEVAQSLLRAWEADMAGDAADGLARQQRVFARWTPRRP